MSTPGEPMFYLAACLTFRIPFCGLIFDKALDRFGSADTARDIWFLQGDQTSLTTQMSTRQGVVRNFVAAETDKGVIVFLGFTVPLTFGTRWTYEKTL